MGDKNRRQKKNIFINKGLQFRIIMISLVYMFMVMIVTTGAILFPYLYDMITSSDIDVQYSAAQTFLVLAKRLMPSTVILFILVIVHQLFVTHRICGPLVNFTNTFKTIGSGNLNHRVKLRKGDYLMRECEAINSMIDGLSTHFSTLTDDFGTLIHMLENAMNDIEDNKVRQNIESLINELKRRSAPLQNKTV